MARGNKSAESAKSSFDIKVTRAHEFDNGNVAFDMEINGVTIYGATMIEGKKGDFVSFPSRKGSDGKYYSHCYAKLTDEDVKNINAQLDDLL